MYHEDNKKDEGDLSGMANSNHPIMTTSSEHCATPAEPCNDNQQQQQQEPPSTTTSSSNKLERLEQEQSAALVLIDHSKKIAQDMLKARNVKVRKAAKRKCLNLNRLAYDKGVFDSKEIDLNQRAIRDEEKHVKNE